MNKKFIIYQEEVGNMSNFIYFIKDIESKEIALIDPAWDKKLILDKIADLGGNLKHILLTHGHYDHINAVEGILKIYDVPVHIMKSEENFHGLDIIPLVKHYGGDKLILGRTEINFLHTPGHTSGSVCYHIDNELITGDTMFVSGCGNCQNGGDPYELFKSLQKLKKLPKKTCIHPGHNYGPSKVSYLSEQIDKNPFLMIEEKEKFVKYRMNNFLYSGRDNRINK